MKTYHLLILRPRPQRQFVLLHMHVDKAGVLEQARERRPRVDLLAEFRAALFERGDELVDVRVRREAAVVGLVMRIEALESACGAEGKEGW